MMIKLLRNLLKLLNLRKILIKLMENPPRNTEVFSPSKFNKKISTQSILVNDHSILTLSLHKSSEPKNHILFFHGGAYIIEAMQGHKQFILNLLKNPGFRVSFFDYPLAPEFTYRETFETIESGYEKLLNTYTNDYFSLMGDSAGGGLALGFLQKLASQNLLPIPEKTVCLSPWLDLTLSNPGIKEIEKLDPILSVQSLKKAALLYAGLSEFSEKPLKNPNISPLYGDLNNLGNILVFTGTHEILFPDCLTLQEKTENCQGTNLKLIIKKGFIHDWMTFPFPGQKETLRQIIQFLL